MMISIIKHFSMTQLAHLEQTDFHIQPETAVDFYVLVDFSFIGILYKCNKQYTSLCLAFINAYNIHPCRKKNQD